MFSPRESTKIDVSPLTFRISEEFGEEPLPGRARRSDPRHLPGQVLRLLTVGRPAVLGRPARGPVGGAHEDVIGAVREPSGVRE